MVREQDLLPYSRCNEYRRFAHHRGYCDPFVPYVGESYGRGDFPKLVYCGVSAWWSEHVAADGEGVCFYEEAIGWARQIVQENPGSAFWRLLDAAAERLDRERRLSADDRRKRMAWTNLSKLGCANETAPPDSDLELRNMDIKQCRREFDLLRPDLLLCVSGSKLVETGYATFGSWEKADFEPSVASTWVRKIPHGGWLYWTMHPQYKSASWFAKVLEDLNLISELLKAPER